MPHIVVIGGGAAGLMAAGTAARNNCDVTVIEHKPRPARKILVTGKGRCNLTNNTDVNELVSSTVTNGRFLYSAFSSFDAQDTITLFESLGVPLKTERGNRVFPKSDKAMDIADALVRYADNCKFVHKAAESLIVEDGVVKGVILDNGDSIFSDAVILATGGLSYPLTGSNGSGYKIAEKAGHTITNLLPSLTPLVIHEGFCEALEGLSLKNVELKLFKSDKKKPIFQELGEMIFTHFGVSGPLILSASAHIKDLVNSHYKISIDLKPALDEQKLDARILRDFEKYSNKNFGNSLNDLLPRKLIPVIIRLSGIKAEKKVNEITKNERQTLISLLKNFTLNVRGMRPIEEAVITSGGIKISEVNPKTMESKICENLYFAGEILDVDAYTGGFNLQIAFSTGHLAGESASGGI